MTPERWAAAQQLFEAALDQPATGRAAYIDAQAADTELARLVHDLLKADAAEESGRPLTDVVKEAVDAVTAAAPAPLERLGPYRLVRMLGEGGMGAVYLAERDDDEFLQQVAIKVVRGLLDPERVRQFRTERQILAWLEHPNIARLLDGGTTGEGLPYLVMEHVEGVPIDRYCDEARLEVAARLRLFLTVCDAVSHAHRSLIVHRDIKPGNILVTDDGQVKLLDFGIARLALESGVADAAVSAGQPRMMTPFYASPEVVRGGQVTTAADVYALGVLLHELLTGTRPLRFRTMTSEEVERVVCHVDPVPPSVAATDDDGPAPPAADRAARRRVTPAALRRTLTGDLDAIVGSALAKDVTARYASVEALAADIRAHLERRPVQVRAASWRYLAGRFVVRHRWSVAAASVALLAAIGAAVMFSIQAAHLAAERDRTARERDTAQQVQRFLTELFEVSNPKASPNGSTVTARELLDRGAERIDTELAGQPVVQARLLATIGDVYGSLGAYARSAALLERAVQIRRATLGPDDPDTLDALEALGEATRQLGRYDDAERLHRDVLAARRRLGAAPSLVASSLNNLGLTLDERGRPADAEPLLREAVAAWRTSEADAENVAIGLNNLAAVLRHEGRAADAVPLLEESIAIRRRRVGDGHPALAPALGQLGQVFNQLGELARAEPLLRESFTIRQRVYGEDHPDTQTARNNLASLMQDLGDLAGAEALYREALTSLRARLGGEHPDVAVQLNNLASLLEDRGRLAEAEPLYRESLAIRRKAFGEANAGVARVQHNLGRTLLAMGRVREAGEYAGAALPIRRQVLPAGHFEIALNRLLLADVLAGERRRADADAAYRAAIEALIRARGAEDLLVADARLGYAAFLRATGQATAALPRALEGQRARAARLPAGHWRRALADLEVARILAALGRQPEAAVLATPATETLAGRLGEGDTRVREARGLVAGLAR
jgi:serine/threonine-protein kinase